jgi:hypothetical protein
VIIVERLYTEGSSRHGRMGAMAVLEISIKPRERVVARIPIKGTEKCFQVRRDGILADGRLYMWEEIDKVTVKVLRGGDE